MSFDDARGRKTVKRGPPPRKVRSPLRDASAFEGERIAKVMARAGLCSRRDAEAWVRAGRVAMNGAVLSDPAVNVTDRDRVTVDGRPLGAPEKTRLFLFNKPRGLVTTDHDPEGRPTVFDYLAHHHPELPRLISIGRLDITTEGLLLLTNDGGLARVLELPSTGWLRRYRVRAHGQTTPDAVLALRDGVTIDGESYQPIEATLDRVQGANTWLTVALREGKNREVRRVLEHLGLEVNRLIRLSYGPFQLGEAPDGAVEEVRTRVLMDQLGPTLIHEARADFSTLRREEEDSWRQQREAAAAPPKRERPVAGKRKHVSALRAERDERAKGERVRTERGATEDRRGRSVQVEHKRSASPKVEEEDTRNARRFRAERMPERASERDPGKRFARSDERGTRPPRDDRPARSGPRSERPPGRFSRDDRPPRANAGEERRNRFDKDGPPRSRPAPGRSGPDRGDRPPPKFARDDHGARAPSREGAPRRFDKDRTSRPDERPARSERPPVRFNRDDRPPRANAGDERKRSGEGPPRRFDQDRPPRREGAPGRPPARGPKPGGSYGSKPGGKFGSRPGGKPGDKPGPRPGGRPPGKR